MNSAFEEGFLKVASVKESAMSPRLDWSKVLPKKLPGMSDKIIKKVIDKDLKKNEFAHHLIVNSLLKKASIPGAGMGKATVNWVKDTAKKEALNAAKNAPKPSAAKGVLQMIRERTQK
jgi:hypothetical protein